MNRCNSTELFALQVFLGLATVRIAGRQRPRNTQRGMATSQFEESSTTNSVSSVALRPYEPRRSDAGTLVNWLCDLQDYGLKVSNIVSFVLFFSQIYGRYGILVRLKQFHGCTFIGGGSGEGTSGGGSDDAKEASSAMQLTPQTVVGQKKRRGGNRRLGSAGKATDEDDECFEVGLFALWSATITQIVGRTTQHFKPLTLHSYTFISKSTFSNEFFC